MSALGALHLALVLLIAVSVYAGVQIGRGDLTERERLALCANLVGVSVLWIRTDKPLEGRVLWVVTARHGLTDADLLALVPLGLAAWLLAGHGGRVLALLKRRWDREGVGPR